jgi:DNA-binding NtrC family response regulator
MYEMPKKEPATILIVDDDPIILDIVEEQVSYFGYQTIAVSCGKAALKEAEKHARIDLLLTDIIMPGMDGVDLARQLIAFHPETRVLFMSGYTRPSMAQYGIPDSEYGFMEKPFGTNTLISKIENALSGPTVSPMGQLAGQ